MDLGGDNLEPGPDYQKAKRSALLISLLTIFIALSQVEADGRLVIKVFDVEVKQYLIVIMMALIVFLSYFAYNFYIQSRREFTKHSKSIFQYESASTSEALGKTKKKIESIISSLTEIDNDASAVKEGLKAYLNADLPDHQSSFSQDQIRSAFEENVLGIFRSFISLDKNDTRKSISAGDYEKNREYIANEITIYLEKMDDFQNTTLKFAIQNYMKENLTAIGQSAVDMKRVCEKNMPDYFKKISAIDSQLNELSDKIAPEERLFFQIERVVVWAMLHFGMAAAGWGAYKGVRLALF